MLLANNRYKLEAAWPLSQSPAQLVASPYMYMPRSLQWYFLVLVHYFVPCSSVGGSTTRVGRSSTVLVYHSVLVTAVIRTMTSAAMILHFLTFLRLHFSGLRGSSVIHAPPPNQTHCPHHIICLQSEFTSSSC